MKKNILILLLIIVVPIKIYSFDYYKNLLDNLFSYYSIGYRDNQVNFCSNQMNKFLWALQL